jgi:hypothetical protein
MLGWGREPEMQKSTRAKPRSVRPARSSKEGANGALHEQALRRRLSSVDAVRAVFLAADDEGIIHVYSVVPEYDSGFYDELLKQERLVEKEFPHLTFEFHVRAHQGREPARAVPFGSQPLFVR